MRKSHNQMAKEMIQSENKYIKNCLQCNREMSIVDYMINPVCRKCCDKNRKSLIK